MTRRSQKGTTLVEVLVAIVVLGLLSAAVMSVSASAIRMSDTSNKQFFAQRQAFNAYEQFKAAGLSLSDMAGLDTTAVSADPGQTRTLSRWQYQADDGSLYSICFAESGAVSYLDENGTTVNDPGALTALVRHFDRAWAPVQDGGYYTLTCSVRTEPENTAQGTVVTRTVLTVRVQENGGDLCLLEQTVSETETSGGGVSP